MLKQKNPYLKTASLSKSWLLDFRHQFSCPKCINDILNRNPFLLGVFAACLSMDSDADTSLIHINGDQGCNGCNRSRYWFTNSVYIVAPCCVTLTRSFNTLRKLCSFDFSTLKPKSSMHTHNTSHGLGWAQEARNWFILQHQHDVFRLLTDIMWLCSSSAFSVGLTSTDFVNHCLLHTSASSLPASPPPSTGASRGVAMETRTVMKREQEEQSSQMSHSMQLSSQIKKKTFTSRCKNTPPTSVAHLKKDQKGCGNLWS